MTYTSHTLQKLAQDEIYKTIKQLEENIIFMTWVKQRVLRYDPKPRLIKKLNELDFTKIKNVYSMKDT